MPTTIEDIAGYSLLFIILPLLVLHFRQKIWRKSHLALILIYLTFKAWLSGRLLRTWDWWIQLSGYGMARAAAFLSFAISAFLAFYVAASVHVFVGRWLLKSDSQQITATTSDKPKNDDTSNTGGPGKEEKEDEWMLPAELKLNSMQITAMTSDKPKQDNASNAGGPRKEVKEEAWMLPAELKLNSIWIDPLIEAFPRTAQFMRTSREGILFAWGILRGYEPFVSLLFIWLAIECYLYSRFARSGICARVGSEIAESDPREPLLPTQRRLYNEILHRLYLLRPGDESLAISIEGEWGSGKTRLLKAISQRFEPRVLRALRAFRLALHEPDWEKIRAILDPQWEPDYEKTDAENSRTIQDERTHTRSPGERPQIVLVSVNMWEFATEQDLHWGLYEALITHPLAPPPWCIGGVQLTNFLRYPLIIMPVYAMRLVSQIFERGRVSLPGGFTVSVSLSGMLWQPYVDDMIERLQRSNRQVVWCLDEIDRSSPEMVQAALTMFRRFLDHSGTVILLPYVAQQLSFKAFHPLVASRPDIESTLQAVLYQELQQQLESDIHDPLLSQYLGIERRPDSHNAFGLSNMLPSGLQNLTPEMLSPMIAAEPRGTLGRQLSWHLLQFSLQGNLSSRQRRNFLFGEKYLHQANLHLERLSTTDVLALCDGSRSEFVQVNHAVEKLAKACAGRAGNVQRIVAEVRSHIQRKLPEVFRAAQRSGAIERGQRPVLRHFLDELRNKLRRLTERIEDAFPNHERPLTPEQTRRVRAMITPFAQVTAARFQGGEAAPQLQDDQDDNALLALEVGGLIILVALLAYIRTGKRLLADLHGS